MAIVRNDRAPRTASNPPPRSPSAASRPSTPLTVALAPRATRATAVLVGALALVVIAAWLVQVDRITRLGPGKIGMQFNAAACVLLVAAAWLTRRMAVITWLTAAVSAISLATLVEYGLDRSLGIDQLVVTDHSGVTAPGRMAALSACSLLLLGLCRVLIATRGYVVAQVGYVAVLLIAGLAVIGYLYDIRWLYRFGTYSTMGLVAALALIALAVAGLLSVPNGFTDWLGRGQDAGAHMTRRLLPIALVLVPALGFLGLHGLRHRWWDANVEITLFVVGTSAIITAVTLRAATSLADVDRRRAEATDQLRALNNDLENRVEERTARLREEQGRLAVFEDRERIAADLHDHVIQRLFATGLQLSAAARAQADTSTSSALNDAVDEIDASIRELRSTIFAIRQPPAAVDALEQVRANVRESSRMLGFTPTFSITGWSVGGVPDDVASNLEAVLREALSNIARHAHAEHASVDVSVGASELVLTVSDDGVGMDVEHLDHSSGTANIRRRAERLGGTASWDPVEPHGTTLLWSVPLAEDR